MLYTSFWLDRIKITIEDYFRLDSIWLTKKMSSIRSYSDVETHTPLTYFRRRPDSLSAKALSMMLGGNGRPNRTSKVRDNGDRSERRRDRGSDGESGNKDVQRQKKLLKMHKQQQRSQE